MGSTIQNIQRQLRRESTTPEMIGPMAGATEMTMETLPMVLPRSEPGTTVMIVVISSGIMMAVPEAWMMRAARSTSNPGARPARSVPRENNVIAEMNIERV